MDSRIDESCLTHVKKNFDHVSERSKNAFLGVAPLGLKFTFDSANLKPQEDAVVITNYFSKPCPIQILSPETKYFRVRITSQRRWLNPGEMLKLTILFTPDEMRDYNDRLKIRYFGDQELSIKISAELITIFSFPNEVDFGNVPLGRAAHHEIPIRSCAEKKFSFAILPSIEDPCIDIYPRWGFVKPNQEAVIVMVIYRPVRYISMHFQIRIFIPDLCKTPYTINYHAYTFPGLLRETLESLTEATKISPKKKQAHKVCRKKDKDVPSKICTVDLVKESITDILSPEEILFKQLERFPLYSLHAVNCILNSKIDKPYGEHELRGPLNIYVSHATREKLKRRKEFLIKADNYRRENENAKIHHKPKVNYGSRDMRENKIMEIKIQREQAWSDYKDSLLTISPEDLFEQRNAVKMRQRILRSCSKYPDSSPVVPDKGYSFLRYQKIFPFVQAARKILLRNRLLKILAALKVLTPDEISKFKDENEDK